MFLKGTLFNMTAKRPPPFSLRLSAEERERIERLAKDMPLGAYIKACALNPKIATEIHAAPKQSRRAALGMIIARLGSIAQTLKLIRAALECGALDFEPETEGALRTACADLAKIKAMVMGALRIKER